MDLAKLNIYINNHDLRAWGLWISTSINYKLYLDGL